ncbi:hypothetical protein PN36_08880 [Candidatus Thiomargarita nelsonii]|uniref:ABC transporter domain-containing protein n=1 Tax=Candidatus Thiomargarita nelsonii TaxID=1003181 RepID=A0A0A6RVT8_9GAMM|nr:hypothetical protein PN36_08880 [Candidatus Thiomargarita nelsonii]
MIKVNNLNRTYNLVEGKTFKKQIIYNNLSLRVTQGEFVAIVGPSGCGKSTLLNMIGMLDSVKDRDYVRVFNEASGKKESIPTIEGNGQIILDGQDVTELKGDVKSEFINKNIGFIFQFHHLIPELTALQNVALPMRIQGKSKKEANKQAQHLLEEMELGEYKSKKPAVLSGGEKQRVAIARALINNPKMLLADEPTGSLHPKMKQDILEGFIKLNRDKNITILMVTHDLDSLYDDNQQLKIDRLISLSKVENTGEI